jgi:polyhydroxyalkanoate synthesis regulator phasin
MAASKSSAGRSGTRGDGSGKSRNSRGDGLSGLAEQLVNRIIRPLGLVVLSRERIQETLDEAAERGRLTRTDANELVAELVRRGREQTDDLLSGTVDRIVRGADRARRSVGGGSSFPIGGYDEMSVGQVQARLDGLSQADLRKVQDYERRHANRKTVLAAIDKALS